MSTPVVNRSIVDEESDFFTPVTCARQNSGIISLDELKQMWDERQEEKRKGQQALEELVQRELGVSYQDAHSNLQKQSSLSPRQLNKNKSNEENADQVERICENSFRIIIDPR
eukprot:TRINITY_DN9071_c0_g1_i9.p3 TRINITY_DN9071_c0_g1~~TRINITY_DN9071_c0_g1_i9.p3  ORF type:complete len:113 (+),score=16.00 TRINITY_DN9071_c0_g1_i9:181-519(+)